MPADSDGGGEGGRGGGGGGGGGDNSGQQQKEPRIVGQRQSINHRWCHPDELLDDSEKPAAFGNAAKLARWIRMWTREEDGDGRPVTRGYGVSSQPGQAAFAYNSGGNPEGVFRVGVFQDGAVFPVPPPKIGAGWPPSTSTAATSSR